MNADKITYADVKKTTPARHIVTLREFVCLPLCRDPHVLLDTDAELDLDFVIVVDLDPLHQPGDDHVQSREITVAASY